MPWAVLFILLTPGGIVSKAQAQQGPVLSSSGELCFGQAVTLTCRHPDPFQDPVKYLPLTIGFTENGEVLDFRNPAIQQRFTYTRPNSTASTLSFTVTEEDTVVNCSCFLTLTGGGREESKTISIAIETIQPPTIMSKPDSTSGLLQWNSPSSSCSNYQYSFTLTWVRIGDGSNGTVSTEENRYDFTGMPAGEYTVSLKARVTNFNLSESQPAKDNFNLTRDDTVVIVIVIVVVIVIVAIITLIAIIGVICCCRNKKKRISQSCSPVTESKSCKPPLKKQEAEDAELGQTRQEFDKKQEAENFRNARKNRPIPPLPPVKTEEEEEEERKLAQEAAEITADFKAQVVAILQASKLVYHSLDPEEPVVGTFQDNTFVANFVHAPGGKEIFTSEVDAIVKARELHSTDKGFLVATTDSISGPWLEYLEKHNCHFIGLSRKGEIKKEMLLKKLHERLLP